MILWASLIVCVILLLVSLYYCIKFGILIVKVQEVVEESLDVLDEKHQAISEILSRPLFYDSSEVRSVLRDIESTKLAIHKIAFTLTNNFEDVDKNEG